MLVNLLDFRISNKLRTKLLSRLLQKAGNEILAPSEGRQEKLTVLLDTALIPMYSVAGIVKDEVQSENYKVFSLATAKEVFVSTIPELSTLLFLTYRYLLHTRMVQDFY